MPSGALMGPEIPTATQVSKAHPTTIRIITSTTIAEGGPCHPPVPLTGPKEDSMCFTCYWYYTAGGIIMNHRVGHRP